MAYDIERYNSTVNYLYSLQKHGIKLGLTNIRKLMELLGAPHMTFRAVHVAGTNGKGSTATAISSVLMEQGYKVGLFTSPHLLSFTERIRVNDRRIDESAVIELASGIREIISGTDLNPTFFEVVTAMAFRYFAVNNIEWAVVETGMGGRLDATNIINPDVSVITNIGLDHREFLGDSISDITFEKAGIIKPGVPVITASRSTEVVQQLTDISHGRGSEIHIYDKDFSGTLRNMDEGHITIDYSGYENHGNLSVPLTGEYQLYNMCTAIRAYEVLGKKGLPVSWGYVEKGLRNISMEGRLEWISRTPPMIIDGAHNPEAARSLASSVKKLFPDKKIILVAGIMDDKDIEGILHPLVNIAGPVILTKARYERAARTEKLRDILLSIKGHDAVLKRDTVYSTDTVTDALNIARSICREDNIILITGSFYTTGEVKEVMGSAGVLSALREHL